MSENICVDLTFEGDEPLVGLEGRLEYELSPSGLESWSIYLNDDLSNLIELLGNKCKVSFSDGREAEAIFELDGLKGVGMITNP